MNGEYTSTNMFRCWFIWGKTRSKIPTRLTYCLPIRAGDVHALQCHIYHCNTWQLNKPIKKLVLTALSESSLRNAVSAWFQFPIIFDMIRECMFWHLCRVHHCTVDEICWSLASPLIQMNQVRMIKQHFLRSIKNIISVLDKVQNVSLMSDFHKIVLLGHKIKS